MDIKTTSARSLPQVTATDEHGASEPFTLSPRVNVDKLAEKLQKQPRSEVGARLLLVAAKATKRKPPRKAAQTATANPPPTAAADASALDPVG